MCWRVTQTLPLPLAVWWALGLGMVIKDLGEQQAALHWAHPLVLLEQALRAHPYDRCVVVSHEARFTAYGEDGWAPLQPVMEEGQAFALWR